MRYHSKPSDIGLRHPHYIEYDKIKEHADKLKWGLSVLGPNFTAILCWWCNGTTYRNYRMCEVCGRDRVHGGALGLLYKPIGNGRSMPAPESVVNQVLVAAEREYPSVET